MRFILVYCQTCKSICSWQSALWKQDLSMLDTCWEIKRRGFVFFAGAKCFWNWNHLRLGLAVPFPVRVRGWQWLTLTGASLLSSDPTWHKPHWCLRKEQYQLYLAWQLHQQVPYQPAGGGKRSVYGFEWVQALSYNLGYRIYHAAHFVAVLFKCQVLTEGTDDPEIHFVIDICHLSC